MNGNTYMKMLNAGWRTDELKGKDKAQLNRNVRRTMKLNLSTECAGI